MFSISIQFLSPRMRRISGGKISNMSCISSPRTALEHAGAGLDGSRHLWLEAFYTQSFSRGMGARSTTYTHAGELLIYDPSVSCVANHHVSLQVRPCGKQLPPRSERIAEGFRVNGLVSELFSNPSTVILLAANLGFGYHLWARRVRDGFASWRI